MNEEMSAGEMRRADGRKERAGAGVAVAIACVGFFSTVTQSSLEVGRSVSRSIRLPWLFDFETRLEQCAH